MFKNLKERYNIFLINRRSTGIICESIYTNNLFNEVFLYEVIKFKNIIISNSRDNLINYFKEKDINSRKLIFCLFYFFNQKFKKFIFPFYFKFEIYRCDGLITNKLKFYEFILNLYLSII